MKPADAPQWREAVLPPAFALVFGGLLGLTLLKLGNPAIFANLVPRPANVWEWCLAAWPPDYGYYPLAAVAVLGLAGLSWRHVRWHWVLVLPMVWLVWQLVAAERTVDAALTERAVRHFAAGVVCFYLGLFVLARGRFMGWFWAGLGTAFCLVLLSGWGQQFGGLDASRRYFFLYVYPTLPDPQPELLKRMQSDRIFATLFYPNTLAGVILLLLPGVLAAIWLLATWLTPAARGFVAGAVLVGALACLYWSRSKGGWLLMLGVGLGAVLHLDWPRRLKLALVGGLVVAGLAGFAVRYAGFFQKGATSVVARFDYWEAALKIIRENPVFGTGPGTFGVLYARIKPPEAEMARLTHNDYLQQATDSGLPGALAYTGFVAGALAVAYRRARGLAGPLGLAVWLGLLAWACQSLFEFGLYIPAVGWPAMALLGWLLGQPRNDMDTPPRPT